MGGGAGVVIGVLLLGSLGRILLGGGWLGRNGGRSLRTGLAGRTLSGPHLGPPVLPLPPGGNGPGDAGPVAPALCSL